MLFYSKMIVTISQTLIKGVIERQAKKQIRKTSSFQSENLICMK